MVCVFILEYFKYSKIKRVLILFISIFFSLNMAYYLHCYFFHNSLRYAKEWHYGMKEVIQKVKEVQSGYTKIWFSKNAWGYIYPLFYLQYPPDRYQSEAELSLPNEYGFGWVYGFDKYIFDDIPSKNKLVDNVLYIGVPVDIWSSQIQSKPVEPVDGIVLGEDEISQSLSPEIVVIE